MPTSSSCAQTSASEDRTTLDTDVRGMKKSDVIRQKIKHTADKSTSATGLVIFINRSRGMSDFVDVILSNMLYMIITACILGVMVFFAIKKTTKLFIYASIILIAFLSYVYYTGESVTSTIEPVEKAVEKAEQVVK
jgi:hypothetical protein